MGFSSVQDSSMYEENAGFEGLTFLQYPQLYFVFDHATRVQPFTAFPLLIKQ